MCYRYEVLMACSSILGHC